MTNHRNEVTNEKYDDIGFMCILWKDSTISSQLWVLIMSMQNELRLFEGKPQPPIIDQKSH